MSTCQYQVGARHAGKSTAHIVLKQKYKYIKADMIP